MSLTKVICELAGAALGAVVAGLLLNELGKLPGTVVIATVVAAAMIGGALGALIGWNDGALLN